MSAPSRRFAGALPWLALALVMTTGLGLGLQGWRGQFPDIDFLPDLDNAIDLVRHGRLPERGNLSSFGAYNPPGPSWLLAPGVFCFDDPRLFQLPGLVLVYGGTVAGVFLLARNFFGSGCACLAAVLYGLSALGLSVANSLWPRFPPQLFYVWMVYWACQWVRRRNAAYLALALATWAAGAYEFLESAPALFILPVLWVAFRPPVGLRWLAAGTAAAFAIWFPYLRYEWGRGLLDVKSLVTQTELLPRDHRRAWCDPQLPLRVLGSPNPVPDPALPDSRTAPRSEDEPELHGWRALVWSLWPALRWGVLRAHVLLRGFETDPPVFLDAGGRRLFLRGAGVLLLLATASAVALFGRRPRGSSPDLALATNPAAGRLGLISVCLGACLLGVGLVANEWALARFVSHRGEFGKKETEIVRALQAVLLLAGTALILRRYVTRTFQAGSQTSTDARPLVLSLLTPWVLLTLLAEANRGDRLWWLWPLQAIFLSALVTVVPRRLGLPRLVTWVGGVSLLLLTFGYGPVAAHVYSWRAGGWSGRDAEAVRVVDAVAADLRAAGKDRATIGYQITFTGGEARQYALDPRYKVGADWDFLLGWRHGVTNDNHCPEGLSPRDDYRVVEDRTETGDKPAGADTFLYFQAPLPEHLSESRAFRGFHLYQRR